VHYRENGEIAPIYINRIGVGQYHASDPRIEAEDYFNAEGVTQGECPDGGFELRSIRDGSWAEYPNVTNLPINALISFRVAALGVQGGTVEVHENSTNGPLLGTINVRGAKGNSAYETISTHLNNRAARESLYLVFHGGAREIFRLNWLDFPKP